MPPSLSELTPILFDTELTHLGLEPPNLLEESVRNRRRIIKEKKDKEMKERIRLKNLQVTRDRVGVT